MISFEWTIEKKIFHYFTFVIPFCVGLFLIIIRLIFEPVITYFGFILSLIALILIIIGIFFLSSVTTKFQIDFQFQTLKLIVVKTQIKFFSRKYSRSYTGMVLEISKSSPSKFKWARFFPIKENKITLYKSKVMNNDFEVNWKILLEAIYNRLILSKRLPNSINR